MTAALNARREDVGRSDLLRRLAQLLPESLVRVRLASDPRAPVGDVVEQDHVPDLARVGGRVGPRSAQGAELEVPVAAARRVLLAVEEHEADLAVVLGQLGAERAGELDHRGGAGSAVVGADEPLRVPLGVVVGADQDRRGPPGQHTDDVPETLLRPSAGERLEPTAGQHRPKLRRELTKLRRARGSLPDRDLALEEGPRRSAVEAVRRRGRVAAAASGDGENCQRDESRAEKRSGPRPPACPCA